MYTQKAFKNGNSIVTTIPKAYLKKFKIRDGSELIATDSGYGILITPKKALVKSGVDTKFVKMVDEFMEEHKDVLQKLANN